MTFITRIRRLASAALLASASLSATAGDDIPPFIGEWNGRPAWVSADHALDDQGRLREGVFTEWDLRGFREVAPKSPEKCEVFIGRMPDHFQPTSSLSALTAHAIAVVSGTIEAGTEGFYFGMPGTLYRVSATYLKGSPSHETYLFYPRAQIRTADGFICASPVGIGTFPDPQPGDRVLWFWMKQPTTFGDRRIAFVDLSRELVHERRDGATRLPKAVRSDAGHDLTLTEVERHIERRLKGRMQPGLDVP